MNIPRFASAAAKLLRSALPELTPRHGDRVRGISMIERALQVRARRRRLRWGGVAFAAAAAALVLMSAGRLRNGHLSPAEQVSINVSPAGNGAALRAGDRAEPLPAQVELASGQRIETPAGGGASVRLSTGTAMDLAGNTSFRVDSQGNVERFSLQQGELSAHVAKLSAGQRFIIVTPDAEVEVRGTRFRVRVLSTAETCGAGSRTRLEVTEGIVEVRSSAATTNVVAGQHWPTDCTDAEPARSAAVPLAQKIPHPAAPVEVAPTSVSHSLTGGVSDHGPARGEEAPPSELAQQNDSFAQAVALRRQGNVSGALRAFRSFMTRFPSSPLVENAWVERIRLLASIRDPGARLEAQRYLARYPRGFAANEAKLLAEAP
jgi:TolA-binding protein